MRRRGRTAHCCTWPSAPEPAPRAVRRDATRRRQPGADGARARHPRTSGIETPCRQRPDDRIVQKGRTLAGSGQGRRPGRHRPPTDHRGRPGPGRRHVHPAETQGPLRHRPQRRPSARLGTDRADHQTRPRQAHPVHHGRPDRRGCPAGRRAGGAHRGGEGVDVAAGATRRHHPRLEADVTPYYEDELVTLYHGDCREITEWLEADVLVTDPPYGRNWRQGRLKSAHQAVDSHSGLPGDLDPTSRHRVLDLWGQRPAVVFGDLMLAPPRGAKLVGVYQKPPNAGTRGAVGGFRRDAEAIYLIGPWPIGLGGRSSVIATATSSQGNPHSPQGKYHHPHTKPLDVMEQLITACPPGVIADPFAGSGSTLVAARNLGRHAIGVEIEERYCEIAARRLAQQPLPIEEAP